MRFSSFFGWMVLICIFCAGCGRTVRRLESENAVLRIQLLEDNNIRDSLLDYCENERLSLLVACSTDDEAWDVEGEESCLECEACMQDCLTAGSDTDEGKIEDNPYHE
jgi:hypothetical protein